MEQRAAFERAVEEMEWGDVVSTLEGAIVDMLVGRANSPPSSPPTPPPPPPPSPIVPTGLRLNTDPQAVQHLDGGDVGCIPEGAAPCMMAVPVMNGGPLCQQDTMHRGHPSNQAGAYSQGQHINTHVVKFPEGISQNLQCTGLLKGKVPADVCFSDPVSAAPPLNIIYTKKRGRPRRVEDMKPYVKKPQNAFMLFMKEQRKNVEAEVKSKGSAAINTVLGQMWQSMTKEEQAKYFELAHVERRLHNQLYPEWSNSHNYGKKRMRQRRVAPIQGGDTQQPKMLSLTTAVVDASTQPGASSLPHTKPQTVEAQLPNLPTPFSIPVCYLCHQPLVCPSCLSPPRTALRASPAAPRHTEASVHHAAQPQPPSSVPAHVDIKV